MTNQTLTLHAGYLAANLLLALASLTVAYAGFREERRTARLLATIEYGTWVFFSVVIGVFMALGALPPLVGCEGARLLRVDVAAWCFAAVAMILIVPARRQLGGLFADGVRGIRAWWPRLADARIALSALAIAACLGAGAYKIVAFPPHVYDVMAYHLTPVAEWQQRAEMPLWLPHVDNYQQSMINRTFLGGSLLNLWGFWFFGNIVVVELYPLFYTVAITAGLLRLFRFLRIRREQALLFTAVVVSTPIVLLHVHTCKNYAAYVYPWTSAAMLLAQNLHRPRPRQLLMVAFPCGLAWSSKVVSSFVLPVTWALFAAARIRFEGWSVVRREGRLWLCGGAVCLAAVTALSWFWVYRNYHNEGTYFSRLTRGKEAFALTAGCGGERRELLPDARDVPLPAWKNLRILAANVRDYPGRAFDRCPALDGRLRYSVDGFGISNFGALYFSFGQAFLLVLALLYWRRPLRTPPRRALAFLAVTAGVSLLMHWVVYYNPWSYRSHMFLPLVVLPAALYTLYVCHGRRVPGIVRGALYLGIAFHFAVCAYAEETLDQRRLQIAKLPLANRTVAHYFREWPKTDGVNVAPSTATVGAHTGSQVFPWYDPSLKRRVVPIACERLGDRRALYEAVDEARLDLLYFRSPPQRADAPASAPALFEMSPLRFGYVPGTTYLAIVNHRCRRYTPPADAE